MNYVLYNDDVRVADLEVSNGVVVAFSAVKEHLLPKQLVGASPEGFTLWLSARSIDLNVLKHRLLVHAITGSRDKLAVALATHMFSISDTFTCFPEGEFTPRDRLCNVEDQQSVSRFILVSGDTTLRRTGIFTPNASTDGSFAKTWQFEDGAWWLYKLQSAEATRSECEIGKALRGSGFDAAEYAAVDSTGKCIRTRNFVGEGEFFEPYDSLRYMFTDKRDDDDAILTNLRALGSAFESRWKDILMADALFMNTDRHMRNFGVIRSSKTGEILRLAPNFDNNQAYKSNPGGRYTDAMLRQYFLGKAADAEDRARLARLVEAAAKSKYLAEATQAGRAMLETN